MLLTAAVLLLPLLAVQVAVFVLWFNVRQDNEEQANMEVAENSGRALTSLVEGIRRQELAVGQALLQISETSPRTMSRYLAIAGAAR